MSSRAEAGYTLIEIIVVVIIVSLITTALVVGIKNVDSRKLRSEAEKMQNWLEAAAEIAILQSSVLGVQADEKRLITVAYYEGRWYRANEVTTYEISDGIRWDLLTDGEFRFQSETDDEIEPFVVFLPSGQSMPVGEIVLSSGNSSQEILRWDGNSNFSLNPNPDS